MSLFVLMGNYDYDASMLLGVFDSEADADEGRKAVQKVAHDRGIGEPYDEYQIYQVERGEVIFNASHHKPVSIHRMGPRGG